MIKCNNLEEVKDCFNKLEELGFAFEDDYSFEDRTIVFYSIYEKAFLNNVHFYISKDHNYISYKYFIKLYNKQIKEKESKNKQLDLLVDRNGKVLKINETNLDITVFYFDTDILCIHNGVIGDYVKENSNKVDYYISKEACEKALKRKEIENKLRLLAFELNGNREIDWDDYKDKYKDKYYICYEAQYHLIVSQLTDTYKGMNIYCYSEKFRNKAIELIGEEDLKDYLINC
ncbi:hypothetical protein [uncultured Clostridium sp.]|uniref:hypothetical protein n=1 Tax=uncultured Clostridium sp. TaxID=59620 RepID=UPI0025D872E1|nr:hypothetical protein [uncultured Clostridium sp.]